MRVSKIILSAVAGVSLGGCIYYVQPQEPARVVDVTPAPAPQPAPPPPAPAPVAVVEYQPPPPEVAPVYQDDLAPYGRWFVHSRYGRVWVPYAVPYGWQPYTVGHWVYTEDGSCYWVPEDREVAWGGIVYHYGQWVLTPEFGWIWVPGTVWAPAWVAWREGGGYCAWTPLPPEACQGDVTVVVVDRYCPPDRYVYCDERYMDGGRVDQHFVHNDVTIINRTTNITNITIVNNRVENRGVPSDNVQRATGRQVERLHVADAASPEEARKLSLQGTPVRLTTPAIEVAHTKVLEQQAKIQQEQQARQHALDVKQQEQANRQKQIEDRNQAAQEKKQEAQQAAEQAHQAELDKQAQHEKDVQAAQQAAREKADEHAKEVQAQQQAAHDAEVQRQQQAAAERQAARDKAAADAAAGGDHPGQPKPPVKGKPKPGQPGQQQGGPPQ